ncbi:hypothetical protein CBR_g26435 [Chara braunii]|uniref:Reverse transcriptase/retrotransposon-derived protein RNase H-like domain-containing protein n=1 Tax=Chara braunii TaxID=69332 RepID=A0A388L7Y8_CHABU|nr:hypothetical protein CBR_g26435 [Chara braunii]|eukprot:GBG78407.1 hypothetical protein CBR_g26435 [Chara braunii]
MAGLTAFRKGAYVGDTSALALLTWRRRAMILDQRASEGSGHFRTETASTLFAGVGHQLLWYDLRSGHALLALPVFDGVRIHGIQVQPLDDEVDAGSSPRFAAEQRSPLDRAGGKSTFAMACGSKEEPSLSRVESSRSAGIGVENGGGAIRETCGRFPAEVDGGNRIANDAPSKRHMGAGRWVGRGKGVHAECLQSYRDVAGDCDGDGGRLTIDKLSAEKEQHNGDDDAAHGNDVAPRMANTLSRRNGGGTERSSLPDLTRGTLPCFESDVAMATGDRFVPTTCASLGNCREEDKLSYPGCNRNHHHHPHHHHHQQHRDHQPKEGTGDGGSDGEEAVALVAVHGERRVKVYLLTADGGQGARGGRGGGGEGEEIGGGGTDGGGTDGGGATAGGISQPQNPLCTCFRLLRALPRLSQWVLDVRFLQRSGDDLQGDNFPEKEATIAMTMNPDVEEFDWKASRYSLIAVGTSANEIQLWNWSVNMKLHHVVGAEGLKPDDAKVASIRDWPRPQSVTEVRSFLGMTDYYRDFVKNYSIVTAPLSDLTLLDTPWEWTDMCEAAFGHLKHSMTHHEVLKPPDPDKPFVVTTNANQYGIGAVLAQQEGKKLRPVEYMSKKMPSQKLAKSTYKKELYVIYKALTRWGHYLVGRFFYVRTDHQTLRWIRTQPVLSDALKRWTEVTKQYDFEPLDVKGEYNKVADAPLDVKGEYNKVADALSCGPDFLGTLIIEFGLADNVTRSLVEAYREDPFIAKIIRRLEAKDKVTSDEFVLVNDLLFLEKAWNKHYEWQILSSLDYNVDDDVNNSPKYEQILDNAARFKHQDIRLERRRREQRGESSGTQADPLEKKISEWVANLSLGEAEEAIMYVPKEEQEAAMKEWEAEEDPLKRQVIEDDKRMEWKFRLTRERKARMEAVSQAAKELEEVKKQRELMAAKEDLLGKMEIMARNIERLTQAQEEHYQFSRSQDIALRSIRLGFREFARELVGVVGLEVKARLENTERFCTGAIEGEEVRPRREPVKVKFPDSYSGKREENFDNWQANVKTYVHLQMVSPDEHVLIAIHALKEEAASFARSMVRAANCNDDLVAYFAFTPLSDFLKLLRERFADVTRSVKAFDKL